jgi:hypothetical protein
VGGPLGVLSGEVSAGSVWWHGSTIAARTLRHIVRQATPHVRLLTYAGYACGGMCGPVHGTTVGADRFVEAHPGGAT